MTKKLTITKDIYNSIKSIIAESSCMAVAYEKVQEQYKLDRDNAFRVTQAVDNDYKYLKVIE